MPVDIHYKNPHTDGGFFTRLFRRRGWGYPDVLRFRGSVGPACVPVLFFTILFSTAIAFLNIFFKIRLVLPDSLVGTVAVVVGLLLAFRTNNAYTSFYEGRRLFCSMCTEIRNSTRNIWVGVREVDENDRKEKERNIKLLLAFAIAVKHHLRLEFGIDYYDLQDLLPEGLQMTNFEGNTAQENTVLGTGSDEDPNRHVANVPNVPNVPDTSRGSTDSVRNLRTFANRIPPSTYSTLRDSNCRDSYSIWFGAQEWGTEVDASMSLPLEIIYHVGLYIDRKRNNINDAYGAISGALNSLVDSFGNLERIGNTPLPVAYFIHLKQAVLIYVWILPFTLVATLGWFMIPTVALVGFVLFGVEAIGAEIENPFGYDTNDLPLDGYCKDLEAEIKYLERHIPSVKAVPASHTNRSS